jgi:plasmid replication initiation protein
MNGSTHETAISIKYNKDFSVIQANELVRSKQDELTLLEAKIVRLAITQIVREDNQLNTYTCNVVDLANFLGIDNHNIYRDIQDIARSLIKKSIFIKDKNTPRRRGKENYVVFNWVDFIEYRDGVITFKLNDKLKPYLLGLEELFTMYGYDAIIGLPTNNSIRLYELLASYQNMTVRNMPDTNYTDIEIARNEFIFTIDYLREYFNCQDKYPNTGDFVKNVIDSSVKAILKNTFMRVGYRKVKTGRSISHIVFKIDSSWKDTDITEQIYKLRGWEFDLPDEKSGKTEV